MKSFKNLDRTILKDCTLQQYSALMLANRRGELQRWDGRNWSWCPDYFAVVPEGVYRFLSDHDVAMDLADQIIAMEKRYDHFKSSSDGSYGQALFNAGHHKLESKLQDLGYKMEKRKLVKV